MEVLDSIQDVPEHLNLVKSETSLSGSFLDVTFDGGALKYYSQFGKDVQERFLQNTKGEILAKALCYTKEFYEKDKGKVKVLIVTDVRTLNSREALLGWSDFLLPEILKVKKEMEADYALFFLSRRQRGVFDFFIRPRKVRADQIRFSHLRGAGVQIVQGKKFFSQDPLQHIQIRRAHEEDLPALKSFVKASSNDMPLSRSFSEENFFPELISWRDFGLENLAIALDSEDKIVGSLGAFDVSSQGECAFKFDEILDPTFLALQGFLKTLSWVTDLRPVLDQHKQNVKFFTHMYFNNHDIFYSMICWWLKRTKQEKAIFMYPSYTGDLKAFPPSSLFSSVFKGDLYLVQSEKGPPSELLKPAHFSTALDIDLPLIL